MIKWPCDVFMFKWIFITQEEERGWREISFGQLRPSDGGGIVFLLTLKTGTTLWWCCWPSRLCPCVGVGCNNIVRQGKGGNVFVSQRRLWAVCSLSQKTMEETKQNLRLLSLFCCGHSIDHQQQRLVVDAVNSLPLAMMRWKGEFIRALLLTRRRQCIHPDGGNTNRIPIFFNTTSKQFRCFDTHRQLLLLPLRSAGLPGPLID